MTPPAIRQFRGPYRFLSNFDTEYPITIGQTTAPSLEHVYQAWKTVDPNLRAYILMQPTPGDAKRAGRRVVLREDWEILKISVMRTLLWHKFAVGSPYAKALLETGDAYLEEGNTWGDTVWGVCRGEGENWLGFLLMGTRAELRGLLT